MLYYIHVNKPREGYDGRFPVDRIKNSVLKRPALRQPFVQGQKGHPSDREGTHNGAGRVSLGVCPIYTQRQPPTTRHGRLSAPFRPSAVCTLRDIGADKPTMHCGAPRAIPANRAGAWRFYYEKSETLGWIEPLFLEKGEERHRGTGTVSFSLRVPKCLPSLLNARWTWKGEDGFERRVETHGFTERFKDACDGAETGPNLRSMLYLDSFQDVFVLKLFVNPFTSCARREFCFFFFFLCPNIAMLFRF